MQSLLLFVLLLLASLASAEDLFTQNPNKVKAAFLRNFAHYVQWPYNTFINNTAPWHIGVLGPDPFGEVLEATFHGRTEQGRSFVVFRAAKLEDLPPCHILFIAYPNATQRRASLSALKDKPVLTVGDAPEFLSEGGVIRFQVTDRVSMSINLDQARAVLLTIQTKMLEVSSEILENGALRQVR